MAMTGDVAEARIVQGEVLLQSLRLFRFAVTIAGNSSLGEIIFFKISCFKKHQNAVHAPVAALENYTFLTSKSLT